MKVTKELIPEYLANLNKATDDQLVQLYKIAISQDKPSDKKAFEVVANAIDKERKKRGTITSISSKIVQPSVKKSSTIADSYENE